MKRGFRPDLRPMREKTLEELEGATLGEPPYNSYLVTTIHALRKKPIGEFTVEDLRITLRQRRGVPFLLPIALEWLEANPLAAGHFYPGDLLLAVLRAEPHWRGLSTGNEYAQRLRAVVERALAQLDQVTPTDWDAAELPDPDELDELDREKLEPELRAALAVLA